VPVASEEPDVVLSNLVGAWPGLVRNVNTLYEMVAGTKKANKEILTVVEEELEALSTQLLLLPSRVGDRPERAQGASAFNLLMESEEQFQALWKDLQLKARLR
jgi:hypothetical protein